MCCWQLNVKYLRVRGKFLAHPLERELSVSTGTFFFFNNDDVIKESHCREHSRLKENEQKEDQTLQSRLLCRLL